MTARSSNNPAAELGGTAPAFTLPSSHGPITLNAYRAQKTVALYFMREFNCPTCLKHVLTLKRLQPYLEANGVQVLVVGGGGLEGARMLATRHALPFPVLSDAERTVYVAYGLERLLGFWQKSGLALIDQSGTLRHVQRSANPNAGFSQDDLEAALKTL